ncbi:MAG: hypothetical protein LBT20_01170 [Clostridiales bacterium]|nr:hypothetical protein [Clostridiales bacterium]
MSVQDTATKRNTVYKRQFAFLLFFSGTVFKIAFLPSYITEAGGHANLLLIGAYLLFEFLLLIPIFCVVKYNLLAVLPKNFRAGVMILLFAFCAVKFSVMSGEAVFCISDNLFKDAYLVFIFFALTALVSYIAVKGSTVLARMSELFIFIVVVCLIVNLITVQSDMDFMFNLPLVGGGTRGFFGTLDRFLLWTGDFVPLMVFTLAAPRNTDASQAKNTPRQGGSIPRIKDGKKAGAKKSKVLPIMIGLTVVIVFAHYVFLNAIFKSAGEKVDNLIVDLGTFNIGNILVGRTDALSLGVWFVMIVLNLSLTMLAATEASSYFLRDRRMGTVAVNVFAVVLYLVGFKNMSKMFDFATGGIRYFMLAAEIVLPTAAVVGAWMKVKVENGKLKFEGEKQV